LKQQDQLDVLYREEVRKRKEEMPEAGMGLGVETYLSRRMQDDPIAFLRILKFTLGDISRSTFVTFDVVDVGTNSGTAVLASVRAYLLGCVSQIVTCLQWNFDLQMAKGGSGNVSKVVMQISPPSSDCQAERGPIKAALAKFLAQMGETLHTGGGQTLTLTKIVPGLEDACSKLEFLVSRNCNCGVVTEQTVSTSIELASHTHPGDAPQCLREVIQTFVTSKKESNWKCGGCEKDWKKEGADRSTVELAWIPETLDMVILRSKATFGYRAATQKEIDAGKKVFCTYGRKTIFFAFCNPRALTCF
jgi:hypothetical protein